jgi:putative tricarboxylic transport membrane protein
MRRFIMAGLAALSVALPAQAQEYRILAPAGPGGGWDQTARTMQMALQQENIAKNVQVMNVPGAGGTIGLAQFINQSKGDPSALIVGGYVMVGAIIANKSPVSLTDVTPVARLTGEYDAIVVPADSPHKTMADLVAALKKNPGAVSWAGGSAGGVDHIAVGMIAKAVGVDPTKINYVAFSGGGEALAAILGSKVTAGISGYGEFESQINAGKLRLLALTGDKRMPGVNAPTLKEQGIDVALQNWRMVSAAPGLSQQQAQKVTADIEKMAKSKVWQDQLKAKGWIDTFLAGDDFRKFLQQEIASTGQVLKDLGIAK